MLELLGAIGSPIDVATFGYVVYELRTGRLDDVAERTRATAAGSIAIARRVAGVNADALQSDLDVADRHVDGVMTDGAGREDR